MFRVRQVDEEAEDEQHVRPNRSAFEIRRPRTAEGVCKQTRYRCPRRGVFVEPESDLARVPEKKRDHDAGDEQEDHVGLAHVAAGEPPWPLHLADDECGDHAGEHEESEDVDEERIPALAAEPWQRGVLVDDADHRDEDGREQHDEAPEDRGMHKARQQALQQLALSDDDDCFSARASWDVVETRGRLAHPDEAIQKHGAPAGEHAGNGERGRQDGRRHWIHLSLRSSAEIAGTTSRRSPITA